MTAARSALQRSLTLNPASPSNRLKWAQLVFISGERAQAQQLLVALRDANFSTDEKKTLNELLATYNIAGH
jgi:Tfp pilus assembly protein PilF